MASSSRHMRRLGRRLLFYLPLIWLLTLTVGYLILHYPGHPRLFSGIAQKPGVFDPQRTFEAVSNLVLTVLGFLSLSALGTVVGRLLWPQSTELTALERTLFQLLVGLGSLSLLGLLLGLLGAYPPRWLVWVLMLTILAGLYRTLFDWLNDFKRGLQSVFEPTEYRYIRLLRWVSLVFLILAVLLALAPPTKWDALTYHLAGPQAYLAAGRVIPLIDNHFLGFPQLVETLYLWQLLIATPQAAVLMHTLLGTLMLLLVVATAYRLQRPAAGWVAVSILLLSKTIWASFHWPYNDLGLMAYATAAFLMLLRWADSDYQSEYLILAGVFTGFAVGCKYTAGGASIGLGVLALWLARRRSLWFAGRSAASLTFVALILFSPWLLKNLILYGNPVAPFGPGTAGFDELDAWYYLRPWTGFIAKGEPFDAAGFFLAPMQFSIFGYDGVSPYMANITPLIIGLLPFMFIGWKQRPEQIKAFVGHLFVFTVPAYLFWLYGSTVSWYLIQTRLLFAIFPMLALVSGLALVGLKDIIVAIDLRMPALITVIVVTLVAVINTVLEFVAHNPLYVVVGLQTQDEYLLSSGTGTHYFAMQQINTLPAGSTVQFLWEPRTYYCDQDVTCIPDSLINEWWHGRQTLEEPEAIVQSWVEADASHVLIFEAGRTFLYKEEPYEPVMPEDIQTLDALRGSTLQEVWRFEGEFTLYEIQLEANIPR